eukprot:333693_1
MRNISTNNGQSTELKVKLVHDTQIRQWRYPPSNQYESLVAFVKTSFHINDFLLQFTDDEGDRLTIASQKDLIESYNACKQQFRRSFRIFIISKEANNKSNHINSNNNINNTINNNDPIEFHWGSSCNKCKTSPIQGVRYKCCICSNYDLCTNCKSIKDIHDKSHPFIQLNIYKNKLSRFGVSVQNTHFIGLQELFNNLGLIIGPQPRQQQQQQQHINNNININNNNLSAELICDLTLRDGISCIMDSIETKKWRLKNTGLIEWGYNVELVFISGSKEMLLNKRVSGPNCQPGQNTDITLSVKIPNKIGKYKMYYQLFTDNKPFGPKLSVNINAIHKNNNNNKIHNEKYDLDNQQEIIFENNNNKPKGRRSSMV